MDDKNLKKTIKNFECKQKDSMYLSKLKNTVGINLIIILGIEFLQTYAIFERIRQS